MDDQLYSVSSPEPTTPEGVYAKALAEALQADPTLTTAFVSANTGETVVGILDPAVSKKLPSTTAGKASKATLDTLRTLYAAIPVTEVPA